MVEDQEIKGRVMETGRQMMISDLLMITKGMTLDLAAVHLAPPASMARRIEGDSQREVLNEAALDMMVGVVAPREVEVVVVVVVVPQGSMLVVRETGTVLVVVQEEVPLLSGEQEEEKQQAEEAVAEEVVVVPPAKATLAWATCRPQVDRALVPSADPGTTTISKTMMWAVHCPLWSQPTTASWRSIGIGSGSKGIVTRQ